MAILIQNLDTTAAAVTTATINHHINLYPVSSLRLHRLFNILFPLFLSTTVLESLLRNCASVSHSFRFRRSGDQEVIVRVDQFYYVVKYQHPNSILAKFPYEK